MRCARYIALDIFTVQRRSLKSNTPATTCNHSLWNGTNFTSRCWVSVSIKAVLSTLVIHMCKPFRTFCNGVSDALRIPFSDGTVLLVGFCSMQSSEVRRLELCPVIYDVFHVRLKHFSKNGHNNICQSSSKIPLSRMRFYVMQICNVTWHEQTFSNTESVLFAPTIFCYGKEAVYANIFGNTTSSRLSNKALKLKHFIETNNFWAIKYEFILVGIL